MYKLTNHSAFHKFTDLKGLINLTLHLSVLSDFLSKAKQDHLLLSNRSHAFACLDRFHEALEDAERVVKLRPDWPKVRYIIFYNNLLSLYGDSAYLFGHYKPEHTGTSL